VPLRIPFPRTGTARNKHRAVFLPSTTTRARLCRSPIRRNAFRDRTKLTSLSRSTPVTSRCFWTHRSTSLMVLFCHGGELLTRARRHVWRLRPPGPFCKAAARCGCWTAGMLPPNHEDVVASEPFDACPEEALAKPSSSSIEPAPRRSEHGQESAQPLFAQMARKLRRDVARDCIAVTLYTVCAACWFQRTPPYFEVKGRHPSSALVGLALSNPRPACAPRGKSGGHRSAPQIVRRLCQAPYIVY